MCKKYHLLVKILHAVCFGAGQDAVCRVVGWIFGREEEADRLRQALRIFFTLSSKRITAKGLRLTWFIGSNYRISNTDFHSLLIVTIHYVAMPVSCCPGKAKKAVASGG